MDVPVEVCYAWNFIPHVCCGKERKIKKLRAVLTENKELK